MDAIADSMFMLGEFNVFDAQYITDCLKQAGMKVDIRTFTLSDTEVFHYLEGRMSEVKAELEEERFQKYARFLEAFKRVLAKGATSENFREMLHLELDPDINKKRELFGQTIKGSISKEEQEAKMQDSDDIFKDLMEVANAESFIDLVLERNDIRIGDYIGAKLDDPVIRIFAEEDEDDESKFARTTTSFSVEPSAAIFVDEFSTVFSENLDKEFKDEYSRLFFLGKLISDLAESSSGKMDMESFAERCEFKLENNGNLLEISGKRAAEELARSLEKNDIIKVKGDSIKWKR